MKFLRLFQDLKISGKKVGTEPVEWQKNVSNQACTKMCRFDWNLVSNFCALIELVPNFLE